MHLRCMTLFGLCAQDYFSRAGHELLDWLGFIFDPADVINFLWYTAEGNAAMAAATAVAIVPAAGSFIAKGTKQAIKAGKKAAQKAGEKAAKNATEKAAKKAAAKKLAKEAGKEAAEKGAEKAAKEAAEKATEKTAKETAEKTAKEAAEKGIKSGTSAKGLIGHDFEDYLSKTIGGEGSFSVGGRDFDGGIGNRWWEAKSGNYWRMLEKNPNELAKFKSDMGNRLKIATENGATYEIFANTPIPESIKQWLTKKGIKFTELID